MKIQTFRRLIQEDVEEQFRPLVAKIGEVINTFAEDVINGLNKNITIEDNLNQFMKDIVVQVNSSGTPTVGGSFQNTLSSSLRGITVIKATHYTSSNTYVTTHPFLSFTENNKVVTIQNITGLPADNKFTLKLLCYG
jgi:hypothetical protein